MSIRVYTNSNFPVEIVDVVKLYNHDVVIVQDISQADVVYMLDVGAVVTNSCSYGSVSHTNSFDNCEDILHSVRLQKRYAKMVVYQCMVEVTGVHQPWGCLTGIRPTRLAYQLSDEGLQWQSVYAQQFDVREDKIDLVSKTLVQQQALRTVDDSRADMYVAIPFCKTRCSYCSFTSGELSQLSKHVDTYVQRLIEDIKVTQQLARNDNITLGNLYFGGGTPTTLTASQLDEVMSVIDFVPVEYTVEAGRPDTIDNDKLAVMAKHGVGRISINPQTFNDSVLSAIGRQHTGQDIIQCYDMARTYDFDINMDLIAGLPTESYEMFCYSIDTAIRLQPDNITVHTLAIKQGSILSQQEITDRTSEVSAMIQYAHTQLMLAGYNPYYMYRQKYMSDNLENIGFCKEGKQCLYNINMMEETNNILACGANGISKRVFSKQNRLERSANAKDVITYNQRLMVYLGKKEALFAQKH